MRRWIVLAVALVLAVGQFAGAGPARGQETAPQQLRAYWVDAFGDDLWTEQGIDRLVADSKAANLNAIVAQVGRRGDCFCNLASMPRTRQAGVTPAPFEPLQYLIDRAHAQGIQVHAWIITTAIWNSLTAPTDPAHVFNTHGPSKENDENWLMRRYDDVTRAGSDYLLDPGHPAAAAYIAEMYLSVIRNYDVDGVNFDRVRYPDFTTIPGYTQASVWGYNPVAVARFRAATGRTDRPVPTDAQWQQWRRDQVTSIVRKVYAEAYALKPRVRVSADTITYGYGPATQGGWTSTRTYSEVLQDWRGWMEEGILDLNIPMNYKREHLTTEPNNQRRMYLEWNEFAFDNQYRRQTAIGSAIYLNYIEGSAAQVRKAFVPSAAGNAGVGWVGYSYGTPDCLSPRAVPCASTDTRRSAEASRAELTRALTRPSEYDPQTLLVPPVQPVFWSPAAVPGMPWKDAPTTGHLRGTVTDDRGAPIDQVRVDVYDAETEAFVATKLTDGRGWFAFVDLAPGRYKAIADRKVVYQRRIALATVSAGALATVSITALRVADR
ncbi:glycoside hydrolase family 10 protein [soil metagenome]